MSKRRKYAAGLLGCAGLWVLPAHGQTDAFRCNAGSGRSASSMLGLIVDKGSVTGEISVSKMLMHPRYRAVGEVSFVARDGSWKAKLDLIGFPRFRRNLMVARLRVERDGKEQVFSLGDLAPGAVLPFALTIGGGRVIAKLGNKSAGSEVPVSDAIARLACSTATVAFTGLQFSR